MQRPDLVDAGGRVADVLRLEFDVEVELDERWSDGAHHVRHGTVTHAGESPTGAVVFCVWQGRFGQVEAWLPVGWTRRV